MIIHWLLATLHLLALGIGLGAVFLRAKALKNAQDKKNLQLAFFAADFWGIAAVLWVSTGLVRVFAGLEKGSSYYLSNSFFGSK